MKIFMLFLLAFPVVASSAYMLMPINNVHDGDTIETSFNIRRLPFPLNKVAIRIRGIDAPELPTKYYAITGNLGHAKCAKEAELAYKARDFVIGMSKGFRRMKVDDFRWDKYGGRIDANVSIGGVDVATSLLNHGLVVRYNGGKKTKNWCE